VDYAIWKDPVGQICHGTKFVAIDELKQVMSLEMHAAAVLH